MPTPPILLLYFLVQFMRRNLIFSLTHLIIEAIFILYDPLQVFWNHTNVLYTRDIIHNSFNKVGIVLSPSINDFFGVPLVSIYSFYEFVSACVTSVRIFLIPTLVTPRVSNFSHDCMLPWKRRLIYRDYPLHIDDVLNPQYQKGHHSSM